MENTERFQNKKLNKDDHKGMSRAAKIIRGTFAGAVVLIPTAKRYGKPALNLAKTVIFKR